ncbi:MAG: P-loop NTPase, partial [Phycisphaerae bacterium]
MGVTKSQVLEALRNVRDPELDKDLVALNMIRGVEIEADRVRLEIELTTPACPLKDAIKADVEKELGKLGVRQVEITWSAQVRQTPQSQMYIPGVKNSIAIGAGKGGVGKSTIALLTAMGLQREGATVGLLDADVYGPSIPKMIGLENEKPGVRGEKILPIEAHGLKVMSIGFMVEPERAVVWRGPMVHGVIQQFLSPVDWGELDYLIIDLPPGT